jgi:hypothetical protein
MRHPAPFMVPQLPVKLPPHWFDWYLFLCGLVNVCMRAIALAGATTVTVLAVTKLVADPSASWLLRGATGVALLGLLVCLIWPAAISLSHAVRVTHALATAPDHIEAIETHANVSVAVTLIRQPNDGEDA